MATSGTLAYHEAIICRPLRVAVSLPMLPGEPAVFYYNLLIFIRACRVINIVICLASISEALRNSITSVSRLLS